MFSTSGGYHEYIGGCHEYIGGISGVHRYHEYMSTLEVSEPSLSHRRQRPARYKSGSATPEFVDNAQDYFHQIYSNAIDTVTACIKQDSNNLDIKFMTKWHKCL